MFMYAFVYHLIAFALEGNEERRESPAVLYNVCVSHLLFDPLPRIHYEVLVLMLVVGNIYG